MITKTLINLVGDFAYQEVEKYGTPSKFQVDFTNEKGQWLAEKLHADKSIVLLGTLLIDSMLGLAYKEGRLKDHIDMGYQKANEILSADKGLTTKEKENVLNCIKQHHGANNFFSLESEICCNADCYKFASVKGVIGSIKNMRDMPLDAMAKLFNDKADEKWNALSLDICKDELDLQYKAIKNLFAKYTYEPNKT